MSGTLNCLKCGQTVEAESFEKADELIDHAATSKKCSGDPKNMVWYESTHQKTSKKK